MLLVFVHLIDKLYRGEPVQYGEAQRLATDIVRIERQVAHNRTVVMGDFNMNPYEDGLTGIHRFNSVMTAQIALKLSRKLQGKNYPYFYNPMWGYWGDRTPGPPASYYYNSESHWHMFDQVLLRPSLVERIMPESIRILESDGEERFLTKFGNPKKNFSDHLPLLFRMNL